MKALVHILVAGPAVLFATTALGNPIMMELARIREVPGPHVQLTYAVDTSKGPQTPTTTETFGNKSTPWKAASYSANTGSGVKALQAVQMCDCNVPMGQTLAYKVTVGSAYDGKSLTYSLSVTTTGRYDAGAPKPVLDGGQPWDIPDPVEIQGIDCTAECAASQPSLDGGGQDALIVNGYDGAPLLDAPLTGMGGVVGSGGAVGSGGVVGSGGAVGSGGVVGSGGAVGSGGLPGTGGTTQPGSTSPGASDDGGCSMARGSRSSGLFGLVLGLGLALLGWRKRRA